MALQTPSLLVPSSVWELPMTTTFPRQQRKSNLYFFYNTKSRIQAIHILLYFLFGVFRIKLRCFLIPRRRNAKWLQVTFLSLSLSLPTTLFWAWTLFACSISTNIIYSYRIPMHSRKKTFLVLNAHSAKSSLIACIIKYIS